MISVGNISDQRERLAWIDTAKGLGIILVVFGHVLRGLHSSGVISGTEAFYIIDSVIYSFHMPLFFFLSGVLFDRSFAKYGKKLLFSKVDTIVYPYVIWSLLQGGIEAALARYTNGSVGASEVLSFLWAPRAQFWFLYALFFIFVVCVVCNGFGNIGYLIVALFVAALLFVFANYKIFGPFTYSLRMLFFFLVGMLFFRVGGSYSGRGAIFLLLSLLIFVLLEYVFHAVLGLRYDDRSFLSLALACSGIALIFSISDFLDRLGSKLFSNFGEYSMPIYLAHVLAASGVRVVLLKVFHQHDILINVLFGVSLGLLFPVILYGFSGKLRLGWIWGPPGVIALGRKRGSK